MDEAQQWIGLESVAMDGRGRVLCWRRERQPSLMGGADEQHHEANLENAF